jgi:hypothetical protein
MNHFDTLLGAFKSIGVSVEVHDERQNHWHPKAVPTEATKFISTGIAHYHFDEGGAYLGTECNGDGKFVPRVG